MLLKVYREALAKGELHADAAQEQALEKLHHLARALKQKRGFWLFRKPAPPKPFTASARL